MKRCALGLNAMLPRSEAARALLPDLGCPPPPPPPPLPQLEPLAAGCVGFGAALAGYFLLLPLRDEAGVSLGTDKLPRLFIASLLLTFVATPPLAAALNRSHARERGLQLLFRMLSLSVLGELRGNGCAQCAPCPSCHHTTKSSPARRLNPTLLCRLCAAVHGGRQPASTGAP